MNSEPPVIDLLSSVEECLKKWLIAPKDGGTAFSFLEKAGSVVELPVPVVLPHGKSPLSQLFVRETYLEVYKKTRLRKVMRVQQLAVTGTPGTGKSVLGVYCFFGAVLDAQPSGVSRLVYSSGCNKLTVEFWNGQPTTYTRGVWKQGSDDGDQLRHVAWMIFDLTNTEVAQLISNKAKEKWNIENLLFIMNSMLYVLLQATSIFRTARSSMCIQVGKKQNCRHL